MANDQKTVIVGEELTLTATCSSYYTTEEDANNNIVWEMAYPRDSTREEIGRGRSIKYKFRDADAGKTVVFTAYWKDSQKPWDYMHMHQSITCLVRVKPQKIYVREVGPQTTIEAAVGDTIDCAVTKYSIDTNKVTGSTKENIKWQYKIDGVSRQLLDKDSTWMLSENIKVEIPKAWATPAQNKEYLEEPITADGNIPIGSRRVAKNPENPVNLTQRGKIEHVALWNNKDLVDEAALSLERTSTRISGMTSNSDYFDAPMTKNVELSIDVKGGKHSFDLAAPDEIQAAINDGRIKPFARTKRDVEIKD